MVPLCAQYLRQKRPSMLSLLTLVKNPKKKKSLLNRRPLQKGSSRFLSSNSPYLLVVRLLQEPPKLTKSAIKKANRLARLERKQRQNLRHQGSDHEEQTTTPTALPQPVTVVILEEQSPTPPYVPSSLPSESSCLEHVSIPPPQMPVPAVSIDAPSIDIAAEGPPSPTPINLPVPEVKDDYLEKYLPLNGSATIPLASGNQVSVQDPETVKKRQNALTRILWTFIMIGGFIGKYPRIKYFQFYLLTTLCRSLAPWACLHDSFGYVMPDFGIPRGYSTFLSKSRNSGVS